MIGIIGGYGNIGIEAADIIKTNSSEMIRVAGRNISKVSQRAKELFASDKWFQIKESSSNEWKDFIKGCRLVLCSAELGNETVECINRIAGELDCPIVYLGINFPKQEAEGKFIYGAGSIPGLSGIIPQYLAQDFDSVASIDFYYGAKGTFTYTAAKDYMDGVFNNSNRSMVMWKYGKLVPYVPAEVEKTNMYICNEIENMRCFPCIYVPIVADQEIERAKKILEITNANIVLTTVAENSEYMSGKAIIEVDALSDIKFETELPEYGLEDVAYIIFTSGSTGEPKGVTITHAAAVNTIEDINNKNKVTCDDSVLGLSKLNVSTFFAKQYYSI